MKKIVFTLLFLMALASVEAGTYVGKFIGTNADFYSPFTTNLTEEATLTANLIDGTTITNPANSSGLFFDSSGNLDLWGNVDNHGDVIVQGGTPFIASGGIIISNSPTGPFGGQNNNYIYGGLVNGQEVFDIWQPANVWDDLLFIATSAGTTVGSDAPFSFGLTVNSRGTIMPMGVYHGFTNITATSYQMTNTDHTVLANATANNVTIILPSFNPNVNDPAQQHWTGPNSFRDGPLSGPAYNTLDFYVKRLDYTANTVTVQTSNSIAYFTNLFGTPAPHSLTLQGGQTAHFIGDGTNYWVDFSMGTNSTTATFNSTQFGYNSGSGTNIVSVPQSALPSVVVTNNETQPVVFTNTTFVISNSFGYWSFTSNLFSGLATNGYGFAANLIGPSVAITSNGIPTAILSNSFMQVSSGLGTNTSTPINTVISNTGGWLSNGLTGVYASGTIKLGYGNTPVYNGNSAGAQITGNVTLTSANAIIMGVSNIVTTNISSQWGFTSGSTNWLAATATAAAGGFATIANGYTNLLGTNGTYWITGTSGTINVYKKNNSTSAANLMISGSVNTGLNAYRLTPGDGIQVTTGVGVTATFSIGD